MKHRATQTILLISLLAVRGCASEDRPREGLQAALPCCLLDTGTQTAYVANTTNGIDALDLTTGAVRWSAAEPGKPLAIASHRLVLQAPEVGRRNALRIVVLDTNERVKRLLVSDPVVFPDWTALGVVYGRSFQSCGCIDGDVLLLKWRARAWWDKGYQPSPEKERRAEKAAEGIARINLQSGAVDMPDPARLPTAVTEALQREMAKVVARNGWVSLEDAPDHLIVGNCTVKIEQVGPIDHRKLLLKRRRLRTDKDLPPILLHEGAHFSFEVLPDRRSVLVRQPVMKDRLPPGECDWFVFSLETGQQQYQFPYEDNTRAITVLGTRAYAIVLGAKWKTGPRGSSTTRTLKAWDVRTGRLVWTHAVEDERHPFEPQ